MGLKDRMEHGLMLMFALQPEFRVLLIETYLYRKTNGGNNRAINMEFVPTQFHIGRTSYNYYVTGKMLIIGYGLDDGFRDANFFKERAKPVLDKFGIHKENWMPDREGPNIYAKK